MSIIHFSFPVEPSFKKALIPGTINFGPITKTLPMRRPTAYEIDFISYMISLADPTLHEACDLDKMGVENMKDGEMGSLRLFPGNVYKENRRLLKTISKFEFRDADGVMVSATLNIDTSRALFELDLWKTDFSKLLRLPSNPTFFTES